MSESRRGCSARLKVLMIAHEFSPEEGSECSVGWNLANAVAKWHDVTVLCADGHQWRPGEFVQAFERRVSANGPVPGLSVIFLDQPLFSRLLIRLNKFLSGMGDGVGIRMLFLYALRAWHRRAFSHVRRLGFEKWDVIHHVTPIAYWGSGELWRTPVPYYWGPISGFGNTPLKFALWLSWRQFVSEIARGSYNWARLRCSAGLRRSLRKSVVVWTVTASDAAVVHRLSGALPQTMLDAACSPGVNGRVRSYDGQRQFVICWSGQHFSRKALPLLLHAVAHAVHRHRIHLVILGGEGRESKSWTKLASRLELDGNISWVGRVPHRQALAEMDKADILVHTSIREATSLVVLEALSLGLPVVCHDAYGMGVAVDNRCGLKVPFISPQRSVRGFRDAIEKLITEPELVRTLSTGALQRAREHTWEAKANEISSAYQRSAVSADELSGTPFMSAESSALNAT